MDVKYHYSNIIITTGKIYISPVLSMYLNVYYSFFAGSLESAYSLNWGAREIWGKGEGETLALLL